MAWTVVQAVVKATSQSNGDDRFSAPWGSETLERILMKLRIYNHPCKTSWHCDNVGGLGKHVTS